MSLNVSVVEHAAIARLECTGWAARIGAESRIAPDGETEVAS